MDPEPTLQEEKPAEENPQPEQTAPIEEQKPTEETPADPLEAPPETVPAPTIEAPTSPRPAQQSLKSFLEKALQSIQFRKKAKLEKIMKLAHEKRSITNGQAQKLLRVSDATATRYLSALVRQGRLQRLGSRGSARYEPT